MLSGFAVLLVFFALLCAIFLVVVALIRTRAGWLPPEVRDKIRQIARDYPDEVRAWGGATVLQDPRAVQALIAKLESGK